LNLSIGNRPFVIVGLGNPGDEYQNTRHNLGFEVVDGLARKWGCSFTKKKFHALIESTSVNGTPVILTKPQSYMNRSGLAVGEITTFYQIDLSQNLLILSDDLDLPLGKLRLRLGGGSGGHNGLSDIIDCLGTNSFARIRMGIGRPQGNEVESYVLGKFSKSEKILAEKVVERAIAAVEHILKEGLTKAMNLINQDPTDEP